MKKLDWKAVKDRLAQVHINEDLRNWLLAFLIAVSAWLVVTMNYDSNTTTERTAYVNFNYNTSAYDALGVEIVNQPEKQVTVKFSGSGITLGQIHADDFVVYPDYSTVRGSGETTLNLVVEMVGSQFNSVEPTIVDSDRTVDVVFATVGEKTITVSIDSQEAQPAEGYVLNRMVANPVEVTVRGAEEEIAQIEKIVAHVPPQEQPLNATVTVSAPLEAQDADGNPLELQYTTLSAYTAEVVLQIYQVKELPLTINFINVPTGFDINTLSYHLDQETLMVAGSEKTLAGLTEISVASFDLSTFQLGKSYPLALQLPTGLISQEGITAVNLTFDTEGLTQKTVDVSNIRVVNSAVEGSVSVVTNKIRSVTLIGPEEELEQLSSNQVEAQILGQDITVTGGQQNVPVQIVVPASSHIFAVGSYTATVQVNP